MLIGKWWFVWEGRNWSNVSSMQNCFLEILIYGFIFTALRLNE